MYFLINETQKIIFGYSTNCDCTFVKKLFYHLSQIEPPNNIHQDSYNYVTEKHIGYKIILFIKNPYERILSGFIDKVILKKSGSLNFKDFSSDDLTFYFFLNNLNATDDFFKEHHFTPQTSEAYLSNIKFDQIFDINNIDYNYLEQLFGKKIDNLFKQVINSISFNPNDNTKNSFFLTGKEIKNLKNIPSRESFLNEQIKNKIYNLYKQDFEFFEKHNFFFETYNNLKLIIFYHISKNGGTYITDTLKNNGFIKLRSLDNFLPSGNFFYEFHGHHTLNLCESEEILKKLKKKFGNNIFSFTGFRNPIDQIISVYNYFHGCTIIQDEFNTFLKKLNNNYQANYLVKCRENLYYQEDLLNDQLKKKFMIY